MTVSTGSRRMRRSSIRSVWSRWICFNDFAFIGCKPFSPSDNKGIVRDCSLSTIHTLPVDRIIRRPSISESMKSPLAVWNTTRPTMPLTQLSNHLLKYSGLPSDAMIPLRINISQWKRSAVEKRRPRMRMGKKTFLPALMRSCVMIRRENMPASVSWSKNSKSESRALPPSSSVSL